MSPPDPFSARRRTATGVVVALGLAASPAAADKFRDVAPTADGGAWLARDAELWRIAPDASMTRLTVPVTSPLHGVATAGDSLWVLGTDAVARRVGTGDWRTVSLPEATEPYDLYPLGPAVMAAVSPERLLVLRACNDSKWDDCTEAFVVDGDRVSVSHRFDWTVGPVASDGVGGAWAIARNRDRGRGYVHFDGTTWRSWTQNGSPIAGIPTSRATGVVPEWIAGADATGFVGADDHSMYWIDRDGAIAKIVHHNARRRGRNEAACALTVDAAATVVWGDAHAQGSDPTSPVVIRYDHATGNALATDEVDTPGWWESEHDGWTPALRCAHAAGVTWIVAADAAFRRGRDGWRSFVSAEVACSAGGATQRLWSAPLSLGVDVGDDDTSFAWGIRPEVVFTPNRSRPSYGLGLYAELTRADDATFLGGGLTGILYGGALAAAVSVGATQRFADGDRHTQLVVSTFLGMRRAALMELPGLDTPIGIRIDVRPATDDVPGTVAVLASLDLVAVVLVGAAFGAVLP